MFDKRRWVTLALALVALAVGGATMPAVATQIPFRGISSADSGDEVQVIGPGAADVVAPDENGYTGAREVLAGEVPSSGVRAASAVTTAGLAREREPQPDEDGYAGVVPGTQGEAVDPSGILELPDPPDWEAFFSEPQPDDNVAGEAMTPTSTDWSTLFYYAHVAGSALRPRDSSVEWGNSGDGGCLIHTGGSDSQIFNVYLPIPDGVRIDYLRIYYYDTSTSDSVAWVTSYDDEGGYTDVAYVSSDGTAGYGTMLSLELAHVVGLVDDSYVLNWRPLATGSEMALCGLRVAYRLPD